MYIYTQKQICLYIYIHTQTFVIYNDRVSHILLTVTKHDWFVTQHICFWKEKGKVQHTWWLVLGTR